MTQHMTVFLCPPGHQKAGQHRTACGRWAGPESATSWQQTTCAACKRSLAWWKASEQ